MIYSLGPKKPTIHKSAYVAPNATVSGDVTIEEGCAVLFGAVLVAEGAPMNIGANTVVMENAVIKSSGGAAMQFPVSIGESCLIGPGAFLSGCTIEPGCFVAAGSKVFNNAHLEEKVSIAIGAIVQIGTRVPAQTRVPMQHIAFGNPAEILPPGDAPRVHERLNFSTDVFNVEKGPDAGAQIAEQYSKFLRKAHAGERTLERVSDEGGLKKVPAKGKASAGKPAGATRDEPPAQQSADVAKVLDVTFYELEEARIRREAAHKREGKRP